jgi:hypothetical protein
MLEYPEQSNQLDIKTAEHGLVVSDRGRNKVHYLNHTAGLVLMLCNGQNSIQTIISLVQKQFDMSELPEEDVRDIIEEFVQEGLVG